MITRLLNRFKKPQPVLPHIDFNLPTPEFNKQAFRALKNNGAFVLNNMGPAFTSSTRELFDTYDDFLGQDQAEKEKFRGKGSDLSVLEGYYPYGTFFAGRKVGNSYFITRKSNGTSNILPPAYHLKVSMQQPVDQLFLSTQQIIAKTVDAVEYGLELNGEFKKVMQNFGLLTIAEQFLPTTREKLKHWITEGKLTKTEDGKIETFLPHKDLHPLTVLIYRNNECVGLEVLSHDESGQKTFKEVSLPKSNPYDIQPVVISGAMMEILTDRLLPGLEHRVVTKPLKAGCEFSRYAYNSFVNLDPEANQVIQPIVRSRYATHISPAATATFFKTEGDLYIEQERKRAVKSLPKEELAQYPSEDDIETLDTPNGVAFKRR